MMEAGKNRYRLEQIKAMDMVAYLSRLGFEPSRIRNNDHWYLSPLRAEHTPSFKVNARLNRWYDHGMGKGGNLVDFGILFYRCSVRDFLQKFTESPSLHQHVPQSFPASLEEPKITIIKELPIASIALVKYLEQRKVPLDIARQFCSEVNYRLNGKEYYGIGFKNDEGGYEIRNAYFKASSTPKGITTMDNGSGEVSVFEGFTDFLSFMATNREPSKNATDFLVLNSASFFEKARPFMERHEAIKLYLDRDATGQNYSRYALSLSSKYSDESWMYEGFNDLNDWLTKSQGKHKKKARQKLQ